MMEQLVVKNGEGKDQIINVIDIILDNETGKKYIYYALEDEEVYVAILIEKDDKYIMQAITDEEEFALAEDILNNKIKLEGDIGE